MCGIAGFISKKKIKTIDDNVKAMLDTIVHRGPDGSGIKSFDERVAFGHRRLAILDLSDDGLQPMSYSDRYWITFNGEIYNYIELKEQLEKEGYTFRSKTDTEVILAAYVKWGEDCVNRFNGMWAFAIYDTIEDKIFCSRDRYGVKPFYYEISDDKFIFGSEIKELLVFKEKGKIKANLENFIAFLATGVLETNSHTMFAGIEQLSGGGQSYSRL